MPGGPFPMPRRCLINGPAKQNNLILGPCGTKRVSPQKNDWALKYNLGCCSSQTLGNRGHALQMGVCHWPPFLGSHKLDSDERGKSNDPFKTFSKAVAGLLKVAHKMCLNLSVWFLTGPGLVFLAAQCSGRVDLIQSDSWARFLNLALSHFSTSLFTSHSIFQSFTLTFSSFPSLSHLPHSLFGRMCCG